MEYINIDNIIEKIVHTVDKHRIGKGEYCRYLWQDTANSREMGLNAYGCADAANILYTIGRFPQDTEERDAAIRAIQGKQDKETGIFIEPTHHDFHTTAQCVGALELFDAMPKYPLKAMIEYKDKFFDALKNDPKFMHNYAYSHMGAALYSALATTESVDKEWENKYFNHFNEWCNSENGMWAYEPFSQEYPVGTHMGEAFHYLFNYEYAKVPFPYPEKLIDSCLDMYKNNELPEQFGRWFHYIEVDWVFCLNRASRQTPHRFYEIKDTLWKFAQDYIDYLNSVNWETDDGANDLHMLFGVVCCLAELQLALPGKIHTQKPMKVVLDRRPFI